MASRVQPGTDTIRKLEAAAAKGCGARLTAAEVKVVVERIQILRGMAR